MGTIQERLRGRRRSKTSTSKDATLIGEIDGLEELLDTCTNIEKNAAKLIKKAIEPILEALNEEAKSTVPVDTGELQRQFGVRLKTFDRGTVVWGIQSVIGDELVETKKGKRRPSKYFHLVVGGTKKRETEDKKNRGMAPADPFYDTLREKYAKIINETINQVLDEIESEIP